MSFRDVDIPQNSRNLLTLLVNSKFDTEVILLCGSNKEVREHALLTTAKYHLCNGVKDENCPCPSCKLPVSEHPDIHLVRPSAAGNVLTGDLQEAVKFLDEHSLTSDKRCLSVLDVDKVTGASTGDLLKLLEEKLHGILILMTCSNRFNVPATLRSRARILFVGDQGYRHTFKKMVSEKIPGKTASDYANLARYSYVDLSNNIDLTKRCREVSQKVLSHLINHRQASALDKLSDLFGELNQENLGMFVDIMMATISDLQLGQFTAMSKINVPSSLDWVQETKIKVDEETLMKASLAFRRVSEVPAHQKRAMILWAVGALSAVFETQQIQKEDEKNA
jgi:hypothetical protein